MVYSKSPKDCACSVPSPHMIRHEPFIALGAINLHMILSTGPQNLLPNLEIDCKIEVFLSFSLLLGAHFSFPKH